MANLTESTSYDAGIYQLEITDPVLGGSTGIANSQAKGLANRTNWLKSKVNSAVRMDSFSTISAPYTVQASDVFKVLYLSDMSISGLTFPAASTFPQGQAITIWGSDQAINRGVPFIPNGSDKFFDGTVAGGGGFTIRTGQIITIFASGSLWYIIGNEQSERNGRIPAGSQVSFAGTTAPNGWLKCNGAAISRTAYADLFAAIGASWGAGDGSTTFNLPDHRGNFLRGLDEGAGRDSSRAHASFQSDSFASHTHSMNTSDFLSSTGSNQFASKVETTSGSDIVSRATGGSETRPRNNASPFIIKY